MNNQLNILPKQVSFDLKCSEMRWWKLFISQIVLGGYNITGDRHTFISLNCLVEKEVKAAVIAWVVDLTSD